jgi:coenzyme F420-reducing hydrogenase beta subunit
MIELYNKKQNCCGCTACFSTCRQKAITMVTDDEGFLYPKINTSLCNECSLCVKVCSFKEDYEKFLDFYQPIVYAVKHKSEDIRLSSASGGMFTAISDYILENKGIIYGVSFDENFMVCHKRAENKNEREMFKGSKYLQSDLKDTFIKIKEDLQKDKLVLFTGTPCQTAGLNSYLKKVNKKNLFLCDIICHGVPSPLIWKEYLYFLEKKYNDKIVGITFRNKVFGWNKGALVANMIKRTYCKDWFVDYYYSLFFSELILRPSCHECKFCNFERPSDITIADFWGIEKTLPDFNDNKGVSLVLISTVKGKDLFENIKGDLEFIQSNPNDCLQNNLQNPTKSNPKREEFWRDYRGKGFLFVLKKYAKYGLEADVKKILYRLLTKLLRKVKLLTLVKRILNR